jgi:hypothetical protein
MRKRLLRWWASADLMPTVPDSLAAARDYKIVPALIMATSVQITVLADWLQ